MSHEAHTKTVAIRTSRLFALTIVLLILSVGSLIVQVATNRDVNDVQTRTKQIQTRVVALCLNSSTLKLCERKIDSAAREEVVQLCRVVLQRLNSSEVRCIRAAEAPHPRQSP